MLENSEKIVRWIRETVARDYRDDVALVLLYGSFVNGTTHRLSDVDCFFIPKTDRGYAFARTFILDGIGYDVFPMNWERVARIADVDEHLLPLLGDSIVLFVSTPADEERFLALRTRLRAHLDDSLYMRRQSVRNLGLAGGNLAAAAATRSLHAVRLEAGRAFLRLADAVAYANGTYFHRGLKKHREDLSSLQRIPEGFLRHYEGCIRSKTAPGLVTALGAAIAATAAFLAAPVPNAVPVPSGETRKARDLDAAELASFYEELVSTVNKVRINAEDGDWWMAFVNGVCLADALEDVRAEFGLAPMPVLDAYDADDLHAFLSAVEATEHRLVRMIDSGGGTIRRYAGCDAFLADNG